MPDYSIHAASVNGGQEGGRKRTGTPVKTLKRMLKKAGLKVSGKKATLTRRARKARLIRGGGESDEMMGGDEPDMGMGMPKMGGRRRRGGMNMNY